MKDKDLVLKITRKLPGPDRLNEDGDDDAVDAAQGLIDAFKEGDARTVSALLTDYVKNYCS